MLHYFLLIVCYSVFLRFVTVEYLSCSLISGNCTLAIFASVSSFVSVVIAGVILGHFLAFDLILCFDLDLNTSTSFGYNMFFIIGADLFFVGMLVIFFFIWSLERRGRLLALAALRDAVSGLCLKCFFIMLERKLLGRITLFSDLTCRCRACVGVKEECCDVAFGHRCIVVLLVQSCKIYLISFFTCFPNTLIKRCFHTYFDYCH